MKKTYYTVIAVLFVFLGVFLYRWVSLEDWRHGDGVCPVHNIKMREEIAYNLNGTISFSEHYFETKEAAFPYSGLEYGPELYGQKRGIIYVCSMCEKARSKYRSPNQAVTRVPPRVAHPKMND